VLRDQEYQLEEVLPFSRVSTYWWPADLALNWVRLASEERYTHAGSMNSFIGTKTVYFYDGSLQGSTQYGNITHTTEFEWVTNAWQAVRGTRTIYYPNVSANRYLAGLPGIVQTFGCSGTGCDFNGTPIAETQYIYDTNTVFDAQPVNGILTRQRTKSSGDNFIEEQYGYDGWGNRITVIKFTGYGIGSGFASGGAQTTTTCYGGGQPTGCAYDGHATYLLWTRDAISGHPAVSYTYNPRTGNLLSETDLNGQLTRAVYDDYGRLVKVIRPGDSESSPTFSAEYLYQTPTWSSGPYGFSTRVTQRIDAGVSAVLQKYYNGLGQLLQTRTIGAAVNGATKDIIVDYAYDSMGRAWKQSMPRDVTGGGDMAAADLSIAVQTTYDALGRTLAMTQPDGTSTGYAYSISGSTLATTVTDANTNATLQKTDAFGRLISVLPVQLAGYPANPGVNYSYDALDRMVGAVYGSATTTITYDLAGRKIDMTDPDMGKWYYQYDAVGNLIRQTDAKGQRTCLYYDALNRLLGKHYRGDDSCPTPPTFNVSYTYDAGTGNLGQRTGMSDASGSSAWTYDERGRLTAETRNVSGAGTFLTQWSYYANDALKTMRYPGGNGGQAGELVTYEYNPQALLKGVHSDGVDYVPQIVYDAAGRVDEMKLGGAISTPVIQKDYNYYPWSTQGGRLNTLSSALQTLSYTYDGNGNITQAIDTRNSGTETLNYQYDVLDRLKIVNGAYAESVTYDEDGRINERTLPNDPGTIFSDDFSSKDLQNWWWSSYTTVPFDLDNQQVVKSSTGGALNYYTSGFQRITALPQDTTVDLRFKLTATDTHARFYFGLSPVKCDGGGGVIMSADASGLKPLPTPIITEVPPICYQYYDQAGVEEIGGKLYFFVSYAGIGEHSSTTRILLLDNAQADTWYKLKIYRGTGNNSSQLTITVTKESNPTVSGTVTQTVSGGIDWHLRHVIMSGIAYIDDYNERTGVIGYSYADQPHAVSSIEKGGVSIRQYTYDLNGNMTQRVEGSDTYTFIYDIENRLVSGAKNGATLASYTYDGNGVRVKAVENGVTTVYIGDYYEWRSDSTTTTQVKYYYAGGTRVAMRTNGVLTWLLGDHLGSTTITANENGSLATQQTYTAWGQTRSGSLPSDRQYTGQISEAQLGIYFYNARYYDPYLARFISPDSIIPQPGSPQAWDRYGYTSNNPINYIDPSGNMQACADTHDQSCNMDTRLEILRKQREARYEFLDEQGRLDLPLNSNGQKVTALRSAFYITWRRNLYIDYGWHFVDRNWKIKDSAFVSIIISLEFGYLKGYKDNYYEAGLSALSNQYFGTRNMLPSANPDCNGSCTLSEQLSWMMDMEVTSKPPIYSTDFVLFAADAAKVVGQAFGNYWHWGNANFGDRLKGDNQLILETPKDKYDFFYIYSLN
jgi:RHS repeat-associated protein